MTTELRNMDKARDEIIIYYCEFTGSDAYRTLLEERFRQTGHDRQLVFKDWYCYKELPGKDGDLYVYDGVVMPSLAAKGFFRALPGAASAGDVFSWVTDKSQLLYKVYGLPIMLCSSALICRKKDDLHIRNIMELHEKVAIPVRSMLLYYFIQSLCTTLNIHKSLKVMEHLVELIGGRDCLADSRFSDYDGINRFNSGECRYLLGFTESLPYLDKDEYVVSFANFSDKQTNRRPLFMSDFVSIGAQVPEENLEDCLDLIGIMTEERFIYDVCMADGGLRYLLPANRRVYPLLAESDPLYWYLFGLLESGENGLLLYGTRYYEDFAMHRDMLLQFLWEKAGWKL